jgi:hypothetical protein
LLPDCLWETSPHSWGKILIHHFYGVEILRITLCRTCATMNGAEENSSRIGGYRAMSACLSDLSSFFVITIAQAKRIPALRFSRFPHFHSNDYYYGLYPYFKTG